MWARDTDGWRQERTATKRSRYSWAALSIDGLSGGMLPSGFGTHSVLPKVWYRSLVLGQDASMTETQMQYGRYISGFMLIAQQ